MAQIHSINNIVYNMNKIDEVLKSSREGLALRVKYNCSLVTTLYL